MSQLPRLVSLWIGPRLGTLERACFRSVVRQGHPLTLYCYARPDGVPEGIELADAAEIVPASRICHYPGGSPALFANRFRYALQSLGRGTWVDADLYLLKPLHFPGDYLLGEEDDRGTVNNAVLRLPADSPLLPPLLALFQERAVPHWLPLRSRIAAYARRAFSGRTGIEKMPWGATGPRALTALLKQFPVARPLPRPILYPVGWREAGWIADPRARLEDRIAPETVAVHLWNERIRHLKDRTASSGSFLARLQEEGR